MKYLILAMAISTFSSKAFAEKVNMEEKIQAKYEITNQKIEELKKEKLSLAEIAWAAEIAKISGKPLDEIVRMKTEDLKGFKAIERELKIPQNRVERGMNELRGKPIERDDRAERRERKILPFEKEIPPPQGSPMENSKRPNENNGTIPGNRDDMRPMPSPKDDLRPGPIPRDRIKPDIPLPPPIQRRE